MKSENKFKEKMPKSKSVSMKGGKMVSGMKYSEKLEKMDRKEGDKDNKPARKPADISEAFSKAKEGYSKKPRVKPDSMKGKGK